MSTDSIQIQAAKERHLQENHPLDFLVCTDAYCCAAAARMVSNELRAEERAEEREGAIAAFKRGLRWVDFEKARKGKEAA